MYIFYDKVVQVTFRYCYHTWPAQLIGGVQATLHHLIEGHQDPLLCFLESFACKKQTSCLGTTLLK